jgi:hypothetical protein
MYLKSKFYPVQIQDRIIVNDPHRTETSIIRKYPRGYIGIPGRRLNEKQVYGTFQVKPASEIAPVYTCPGCGAALTNSALQCGECGWIIGAPVSDTTDWAAYAPFEDPRTHYNHVALRDSGYNWINSNGSGVVDGKYDYTADPPSTVVDDLDTWFNTGVTAQATGITDTDAYLKELAADGHVPSAAERESFYAGVVAGVEADRTAAIPGPGSLHASAPNSHCYCEKCGRDLWGKLDRLHNPNGCPCVNITLDGKTLCDTCYYAEGEKAKSAQPDASRLVTTYDGSFYTQKSLF